MIMMIMAAISLYQRAGSGSGVACRTFWVPALRPCTEQCVGPFDIRPVAVAFSPMYTRRKHQPFPEPTAGDRGAATQPSRYRVRQPSQLSTSGDESCSCLAFTWAIAVWEGGRNPLRMPSDRRGQGGGGGVERQGHG